MDYRIIALDLDGTLTNSSKEISAPTLKALLDIQKRGIKVALASGRATSGCIHLARQLRLEKFGGYLLSFNGGTVIDCRTNEVLFRKFLPQRYITELYRHALENGVGIVTYDDNNLIVGSKVDPYIELETKLARLPMKVVDDFPAYVNFEVCKCLMTGQPDHLAAVEKKMKDIYGASISIMRSEPFFLEFMPQNVDKAEGLSILLSRLGLSREHLICCGDGFNDISMLRFAGLGVAMGNAQEHVKSAADYVTATNDNNGVLKVIEKFIWKGLPKMQESV